MTYAINWDLDSIFPGGFVKAQHFIGKQAV